MQKIIHVGLDIGSTTVKTVVMNEKLEVIHTSYDRHFSDTKNAVCNCLDRLTTMYKGYNLTLELTGSGALSVSKFLDIPFIQEVIACKRSVEKYIPKTDVVIELGGEDAKIIYFDKSIEQRMNGTCAGGTGAFLDQMASLLNTDTIGLNELAKGYKTIYPIASRCGVFAKTDIQPLINEGAAKEDIAASIFQAVVNQTISGLACGRPIRGNVAFLGGPLKYLSELKNRFITTLNLNDDSVVNIEDAHLLVAKGAALNSVGSHIISTEKLKSKVLLLKNYHDESSTTLRPLFRIDNEYEDFKKRHELIKVKRRDFSKYRGNCYLGIDAGSTTSKIAVISDKEELLYSEYRNNEGNPLKTVKEMILKLYEIMPKRAKLCYSGSTGYGEMLIKTALNLETSEIETIAHYTAAKRFCENATSIIDIGGQDMKYIKIKNGSIDNIMLNEACSSGCGSFIETFAKSLNLTIEEFVDEAIKSRNPVDLGSRCTVFMNSKIKQAQKEGYSVGDISAGLSYSVIKNAIQKVMKVRDVESLGDYIVVQGGTFYNDAVLRAFEIITGKNVVRPDISGLMGAYGIACLARERYNELDNKEAATTILNKEELAKFEVTIMHTRCKGCENNCLLTLNKFASGSSFVFGNRCERGAGVNNKNVDLPNMYKYKNERIFGYSPLDKNEAIRGTIGIPRVLNMYEDYPFWFTLFTELGFRVVLSDKTSRKTYERGIESMPSESVCYPAKLTHGHIMNLIDKGIKDIFYPCMMYSREEYKEANNKYNCPIVISYSEVLKNNIEELNDKSIHFINPFLSFDKKSLVRILYKLEEFKHHNFTKKELLKAVIKAEDEYQRCKQDIRDKAEEYLKYMDEMKLKGIVLSGRPYHIDSEINHGIDSMINSLGLCVLSEDSVAHLGNLQRPLRVVDQWLFHTRLYSAADFVGKKDNLELVQLNSFGCGVDAVTTDQVEEILLSYNKMYTLIKIDEVNNLGAIRIRIRSLIASMNKREENKHIVRKEYRLKKLQFTDKMKEDYTILMPQMSPIHFELLESALISEGYKVKLLRECTQKTVDIGLKYVNNDACYPSILTIGQLMENLESGEYDKEKVALMMSQTGGGCRATNYIGFIRKALRDAGYSNVPVISFNFSNLEKESRIKLTPKLVTKLIKAVIYGDLLQKLLYKNRAYEITKGETAKLYYKWLEKCKELTVNSSIKEFKDSLEKIVLDFEKIKLDRAIIKPKVGIVGEILIKYHPFGNNFVAELLESEGAEVIIPELMGFIKYVVLNTVKRDELLKQGRIEKGIYKLVLDIVTYIEKDYKYALEKSNKNYLAPCDITKLSEMAEEVLSTGNQTGEGWLLTGEMIEFIESGVPNIVCLQPFACLPNHVVGKGVIKTLRGKFPESNIAPIDYDPGASESNQINRIKLMLTVAKDNLNSKELLDNKHINKKDA